jgi:DNA-binding beta-propeller fold protein YncE
VALSPIQKFTPEGKFLASLGSEGTGPGQFDRPTDLAFDVEGNIYVVDFGNNRIQKFAPNR